MTASAIIVLSCAGGLFIWMVALIVWLIYEQIKYGFYCWRDDVWRRRNGFPPFEG